MDERIGQMFLVAGVCFVAAIFILSIGYAIYDHWKKRKNNGRS